MENLTRLLLGATLLAASCRPGPLSGIDDGGTPDQAVAAGDMAWRDMAWTPRAFCDGGGSAMDLGSEPRMSLAFGPEGRFPVGGGSPFGVASADFDRDGLLDLAVANPGG